MSLHLDPTAIERINNLIVAGIASLSAWLTAHITLRKRAKKALKKS